MTTKILHVSDTHLGKSQYQSALRKDDFADSFDAAVAIAREESVDAVIHTGDLFNHPMVNTPSMIRCLDAVSSLDGIPFYAIIGNHERKREAQWMDIIQRIQTADRLNTAATVVTDENGENPVSLYGIDAVRSPLWDTMDFTLEEPGDGHVSILCMHELFQPLVPEERGAEYDLAETIDRFNFKPDALALGDYHSTVARTIDGVDAFYPGATERCSVEETSAPCVYVLEIENGEIDRRTRTIESAGIPDTPREFLIVPVEFSAGHSVRHVERRLDEEVGPHADVTESIVYITLLGEDVPVTTRDVYELLEERGCAVPYVVDKRVVDVDLDISVEDTDGRDVERMVDEAVASLDLDPLTEQAESLVRDKSVNEKSLRTRMNARIAEAQEEAFGKATIERRT